jgi:LysM repeat protein
VFYLVLKWRVVPRRRRYNKRRIMKPFHPEPQKWDRFLVRGLLCIAGLAIILSYGCRTASERSAFVHQGEHTSTELVSPEKVVSKPVAGKEMPWPPEPDRIEGNTEYYTVRRGDTLSYISNWFGVSIERLCELNGIADPNMIRIGQEIRLSANGGGARSGEALGGVYTVRKGDTLWSIAQGANTTVTKLRAANALSGNTIYPGQELLIPPR